MGQEFFKEIFLAICVAVGFAVLFSTPKRALWAVAVLGAAGFTVRNFFLQFVSDNIIAASLAGASVVGISGLYFAHRVHTPPIVFTVPAITNMIPGKLGYQFIIGLLKFVSEDVNSAQIQTYLEILSDGLRASLIMLALAIGIIFPILVFNTQTVKNKDPQEIIRRKVERNKRLIKSARLKNRRR